MLCKPIGDLACSVRRLVVDYLDLQVHQRLGKKGSHHGGQIISFIIGGKPDTDACVGPIRATVR